MREPQGLTKNLCEYFYPTAETKNDNNVFFEWIKGHLKSDYIILDCGAGTGTLHPYDFRKYCQRVVGIDLDERVLKNPLLDEAKIANVLSLPFSDNSFDLIFANNVAEHIAKPIGFLKEMRRILKPNGLLFIKTPNRYHYVGLISLLTPIWFHKFYNRRRGTKEENVFPVFYRMNHLRAIKQLSKKLDFSYQIKYFEGRPNYLLFNPLTLIVGVIYEKIVNGLAIFKYFRSVLMIKIKF